MSLLKPILTSVVAAAVVTIACLFLPFAGVVASEHPLVFFGAVLLLLVPINIVRRLRSQKKLAVDSEMALRKKECKEWWKGSCEASYSPSHCYDLRNIDKQLHIHDGYGD